MSATGLATESPASIAATPTRRSALVFGTGFGIVIEGPNLEVVIVRSRPSGPAVVASTTIADFRHRPAAEWGAELTRFLATAGESRLAATVLLPRSEVIVRTISLPKVADKDVPGAIELQIDNLHPWGDIEVAWGWSRAGSTDVLVGAARKDVLDSYETLFAEAGIPVACISFSTAAIHAAIRIWNAAPASLLCLHTDSRGRSEIYGESPSRAIFSAEFSILADRALSLARAELRAAADCPALTLAEVLPLPSGGPIPPSAPAYAAAIAGSAGRAKLANLLPPERRASHNRLPYLISAALAVLILLAILMVFAIFPAIEQRSYRAELDRAANELWPAVLRAQALEKRIAADRQKIAALDEIRRRPQADLDVLNELTRLLPPPIWTNSVEIYPDYVVIAGEADQAAPLLKTLDSSPLFEKSEFTLSVTRNGQSEQFRIKTMRRGRAGRTTP